MVVYFITRNM